MPADPDPDPDTDTSALVDLEYARGLLQRLREREPALEAEANDLRSQLRDERRLRREAEAIIDERQDEIGRLEAVVEEQRQELERFRAPGTNEPDPAQQAKEGALQKEELLRLTGVVSKQDLEIGRLKDVISTQKDEIASLMGVVESLEKSLQGTQEALDDVLAVQEAVTGGDDEEEEEEEEEEADQINDGNNHGNDSVQGQSNDPNDDQNIHQTFDPNDKIAMIPPPHHLGLASSGPEFASSGPELRSLHPSFLSSRNPEDLARLASPFDAGYAYNAAPATSSGRDVRRPNSKKAKAKASTWRHFLGTR